MTRVTVRDMRRVRYCLAGCRAWFRRHGLDWQAFLDRGIEAERLRATGDALVEPAIEAGRSADAGGVRAMSGGGKKQTVGLSLFAGHASGALPRARGCHPRNPGRPPYRVVRCGRCRHGRRCIPGAAGYRPCEDMAASPAGPGDDGATITFGFGGAAVRVGEDYRLQLADGGSVIVTLLGVGFDRNTNTTSWTVQPDTLSFPQQAVRSSRRRRARTRRAPRAGASGSTSRTSSAARSARAASSAISMC